MAKVAESLADVVIVTSDNPRTEEPEAIIHDIFAGFRPINAPRFRSNRIAGRQSLAR
jgi:UDP-N-acetylmuramoyl-L-alanyl-D-glutamate--2,6-diaminopimelate ligase